MKQEEPLLRIHLFMKRKFKTVMVNNSTDVNK
jgi:hypothetical protein